MDQNPAEALNWYSRAADQVDPKALHWLAVSYVNGDNVPKDLAAGRSSSTPSAHEPIAELGWPAMNMWFALKTPLPKDIKVGNHVRFEMVQESNKQWVIVKIGRK